MTVSMTTLGIGVDTSQVKRAVSDLDALGQSATRNAGKTKDINSAFKQFNDGLFAHERAAKAAAEADARLRLEQMALAGYTDDLTEGQVHFMEALKDQAVQAGKTGAELLRLKAAQLGMTAEAAPFIEQIEKAGTSMRKFSIHTAEARESITSVVRSAMNGDVSQMTQSLTTLAGRAGLMRMAFTGMGLAVIAALGAIGAGLYVLYEAENQLQQLANILTVTGNTAGITADSFRDMTERVGAMSNLGAAREALLALASNGRMSVEAIEAVGHAATTMSRLTGQSAGDVAADFAKMTDGVTKYVDEFDKKYNLLTAQQYEHVRALEAEGRAQEAMTAFGQYVDEALLKNTRSLTGLNKLLRETGDWWKNFWQKAMNYEPNSTQAKVDRIVEEMTNVQAGRSYMKNDLSQIRPWWEAKSKELEGLYKLQREAEAKAAADAKNATIEREGKEALREIEAMKARYGNKAAAEKKTLADYDKAIAAAKLAKVTVPSLEEQALVKKGIRADYAEKPDTEALALAKSRINVAAQLREQELKWDAEREQTAHALGQIDEATFNRKMSMIAQATIASRILAEQQMLGVKGLSDAERAAHQAKIRALGEEKLLEEQRGANREEVASKHSVDATFKAIIDNGTATTTALDAQIQKQKEMNAELGLSSERVRELRAERFALDTAALESQAADMRANADNEKYSEKARAVFALRLYYLDEEIKKRNTLAGLQVPIDAKANDDAAAARMSQQLQEAAQSARGFGEAMTQAFGDAGQAIGGLARAMTNYGVIQDRIAREQKLALAGVTDKKKIEEINMKAAEKSAKAQIDQYGDMAKAAKGFFKEGSKGYAALEAAEKAFRAVELAMTIESHLTKSGLLTAFTGLFVSAKATETAATVASVGPDVAASMTKGMAAAAAGVANQAQGDPYSAWVRMALMAATMAALGFAVGGIGSGGGGGMTAADAQARQGTGTVFGAATDKSNSITHSLDLLEAHSGMLVPLNQGMLAALRNIEASMTGLTNLLVRSPGVVQGSNMGIVTGQINIGKPTDGISRVLTGVTEALLGPGLGGAVSRFINNLWGKTKQEIVDSGIQFGGSVNALQAGEGYAQYASVNTTKSSWFGLKKKTTNSIETQGLDPELSKQFGLVFTNLENALAAAAIGMGINADQVGAALDALVIETTSVSLKDLKGEELTAALNAVLSKAMDQMAEAVFPAMDEFRRVGEGYAETVMRLATNYARLDAALDAIGKTFGATGTASLRAREDFIALAGGLDELVAKTDAFARNFLTEEERLAPVRAYVTAEMTRLGHSAINTRDEFKRLILAQDTTTVAGREMYLALLNIAQAFADTHEAAKDLARSIEDIADERRRLQDEMDTLTMTRAQLRAKERATIAQENRTLFDMLAARQDIADAYERESQALTGTIERLKQFGNTLTTFLNGLGQGNLSALTPMEKMADARRIYEETLAKAKAGDEQAQGQITQAASNYLNADRVVNASSPEYTANFERVQADLRALLATASAQQSEAEKQLSAMKAMTGQLINLDDSTVSLTDAINNLRAAILSLPGAGQIDGLYQSILGRPADTGGLEFWANAYGKGDASMQDIAGALGKEKAVADLYQSILGRPADQAGLRFWTQQAQAGMSIEQIAAAFKQSGEYLDGSHASGLARVPFDGYTAELHAGEAVIDAPAMAALSRYFGAGAGSGPGGNTAALVAEIRALRQEVAQLRQEQERQTGQIVHGNLAAAERSADKAAQSTVEAARAAAWAAQQAAKMEVK